MDKVKGGKIIAAVMIVFVLLIIGMQLFYYVPVGDRKEVVVAFVGFFGSILGGAITLLGVRATIDNQNRIERLNKLPEKIVNIRKIRDALMDFDIMIRKIKDDSEEIKKYIIHFSNTNEDWICETAAKVDGHTYRTVYDFFINADEFEIYNLRGNKEEWFQLMGKLFYEIEKHLYSLEKDFDILSSKI